MTTSKSGPDDYGQFDFPVYGDGPHDLFLTVTDEAGNPLSPTIVIPHRQDPASDAPCHHVVLIQGMALMQENRAVEVAQEAQRGKGRGNSDKNNEDRGKGRGNGRGKNK